MAVHLEHNLGFFGQIQSPHSEKCVCLAKNSVFVEKARIARLAGEGSMLRCIEGLCVWCLARLLAGADHRKLVYEDVCTHPCSGQGVGGEKELPESLYCRESKKSY